jgi:hypothetical protein
VAHALQFYLVGQMMGDAAQRVDDLVILALENALASFSLATASCGTSARFWRAAIFHTRTAARRLLPGPSSVLVFLHFTW